MNNTGTLRRIWLLAAQVIAIAAGLLMLRGSEPLTISVELGQRPPPPKQ